MYIVWNVQEAENVGILASLKISHFPFWFPTLKGSIREWEGNGKNPFPKFGNGKGMKKSIPTFREWESEAIIPKNTREREREWKKNKMIWQYKKYLENMWLEKEFWPINSQPHPPPFLIIPPSSCHCHGHYQWTKKMILFTITNTFAASLFATELSKIPCLFSHLLINSFYLLNINCCKKCRGSWKYWKSGISHRTPIPVCVMANSGMGRERKNPFPFFENENQRLSFPGIAGKRNRNVKQKTKSSCRTNRVTKLHTT